MSAAFDTFDWSGNEAWQAIERNLYFSSNDASENARVLLKRKRKFYKAEIDSAFEWQEENGHQQTYGNKQQPPPQPAAQESPKASVPPPTSSNSSSNTSSNTSSSPRSSTSSSAKSKYGVLISWVQLAVHTLLLASILMYVLPLAGVEQQNPSFFRTMLLNLLAQSIYLIRQHGRPRWNAEYGRSIFMDEQAHFFFLSIVLINATPSILLVLPFFTRSLLFVCGGLKQILPAKAPRVYALVSKPLETVVSRYQEIYQMNALLEVIAGFSLIIGLVSAATRNFMLLLGFGQYLRIRYMLSEDSKRAFGIVRGKTDSLVAHQMCPAIVRTGYEKLLALLEQWTDQEAMAQQAQQPGLMSKCTIM